MATFKEPEAYLRSGSNELKILEYVIDNLHLGINILKVSRILERPKRLVRPGCSAHSSVIGLFEDHGRIIPLVQLGVILNLPNQGQGRRVIITEFFDEITGFLVDSAEQVHTLSWNQVMGAEDFMHNLENPYVLAVARPTPEQHILLIDYEKVVLELAPGLATSKLKDDAHEWKQSQSTVLIAEDSTPVREMLQLELEERGIHVLTSRDGEEADVIFKSHPEINLVIADVEMPKMDGLALLGNIRLHPERGQTPVVVYSSIGDIGMKERARVMEANAHITKLEMDELFRYVKEFLKV
ncbi:MAG: response regulator [Desulfobacterales bacterium]|nr:response regulator [Desulfobacterales bacterium]